MKPQASLRRLLQRIHADERGAVSIETILIIGAIAIPILIFLLRYGWPRIKNYFNDGMTDLEAERGAVQGNR
jgi:Flp pilus assembly pilin Flp